MHVLDRWRLLVFPCSLEVCYCGCCGCCAGLLACFLLLPQQRWTSARCYTCQDADDLVRCMLPCNPLAHTPTQVAAPVRASLRSVVAWTRPLPVAWPMPPTLTWCGLRPASQAWRRPPSLHRWAHCLVFSLMSVSLAFLGCLSLLSFSLPYGVWCLWNTCQAATSSSLSALTACKRIETVCLNKSHSWPHNSKV
jgi:hypothetical protein